jgi:non-ribosomal peptide synthetase component E (peptide arylation enzyme)
VVVSLRAADASSFGYRRQRRVGYKAPDEILVLDEMPCNAVGKVDRAALAQLADAAVNRHLA